MHTTSTSHPCITPVHHTRASHQYITPVHHTRACHSLAQDPAAAASKPARGRKGARGGGVMVGMVRVCHAAAARAPAKSQEQLEADMDAYLVSEG